MHRRKPPTSLCGTWRQQQLVTAAAEHAVAQPTLATRPLMLQVRLDRLKFARETDFYSMARWNITASTVISKKASWGRFCV